MAITNARDVFDAIKRPIDLDFETSKTSVEYITQLKARMTVQEVRLKVPLYVESGYELWDDEEWKRCMRWL